MIKVVKGKGKVKGTMPEVMTEATILLLSLYESWKKKAGKECADDMLKYIFETTQRQIAMEEQ